MQMYRESENPYFSCTFFEHGYLTYYNTYYKSEKIGYKFIVILILGIPPCVLYHWIEIKSAFFLCIVCLFTLIRPRDIALFL